MINTKSELENNPRIINKGETVEFYCPSETVSGWVMAEVKDNEGEFYLIEYKHLKQVHSKIVTRNEIRHVTGGNNLISISTHACVVYRYSLNFLNFLKNKKIRKIEHLITQIKRLVEVGFLFYSKQSNMLFVFIDKAADFDQIQILNEIMEAVKEHYVSDNKL